MPKGSKKENEIQSSSSNGVELNDEKDVSFHITTAGESKDSKQTVLTGKINSKEGFSEEVPEEAPYVIVIHGPPKVGKSLLIKSLIKHYTMKKHAHIQGPITIASANRRRIQFVECPNNMNGMIDAAKCADAVMLVIDANYGFEMETFEFLNLFKVHGMPLLKVHGMTNVMGVLTYLDELKDENTRTITKQRLMEKFRTEIYEEAHIFYLSGLLDGMYQDNEMQELADFLSHKEFHISPCRATHPYLLVDRFEDVTSPEEVNMDSNCRRNIFLYGYLRGCDIKRGSKVHIAGVGDYPLADVTISADPCPLPPPDNSNELKMQINIEQNNLDEEPQLEIGSFRIGTYLMFEVLGVPFEMVTNRDPCQPILVGGISPAEETAGYMQARLQRHSWHMNLLKTNDPIIVSVGWRRYQTTPYYTRDHVGRQTALEYTPKDEACVATFWGSLAPCGAGVVVVQSLANNKATFRILATAVVLNPYAVKIWKKTKRIGTPCLILEETALIKGMFKSDDEVDLHRNGKIKTDDGIRGAVSEAAKSDFSEQGIAKCTFDRVIRMGDTIFMSQWIKIEVPRISNPPTASLEPSNCVWQSMDSVEKTQKKLDGTLDCKAYVLVIDGNKIAAEVRSKMLTEIFLEKLKDGPAQTRGTLEQLRPVIFNKPLPFGWNSELRRKCVSKLVSKQEKNMSKTNKFGLSTRAVLRQAVPAVRRTGPPQVQDFYPSNTLPNSGSAPTLVRRVSTGTAGGQGRKE